MEYPEDVCEAAIACTEKINGETLDNYEGKIAAATIIANAIMAERERCKEAIDRQGRYLDQKYPRQDRSDGVIEALKMIGVASLNIRLGLSQ